jgi:hypothetical protein
LGRDLETFVSDCIDEVFMPQPEVQRVIAQIEALLLQTWSDTGFGQLEIESERINGHRVILRHGTHYRYVLTEADVQARLRTGAIAIYPAS